MDGRDEVPKHRSRKNTKRWCKGRRNVEHTPCWEADLRFGPNGRVYACRQCRKHLDYYFALPGEKMSPPEIGSTEPRP